MGPYPVGMERFERPEKAGDGHAGAAAWTGEQEARWKRFDMEINTKHFNTP